MAKTYISTATSRPPASSSSSSKRPFRRRPASLIAAPSSGLLVLLATLVSSTTAGGLPLDPHTAPPDFLCPSVHLDAPSDRPYPPRRTYHAGDSAYAPPPRPTRVAKRGARRVFVPDKYAQGEDGRWRKTQSWTLYGSTMCECSEETDPPVVDDQVDPTASVTPTVTLSATATMADAIATDSLPPGWSKAYKDNGPTPIIIGLSVVLAIFICLFILGCVTWRRKRRALTQKDEEKRARKNDVLADELEEEIPEGLKRMRTQQKLWAKATARWKANVRFSARRRRGKRPITTPSNISPRESSDSLTRHHNSSTASLPRSISIADEPNDDTGQSSAHDIDCSIHAIESANASTLQYHPPAYPTNSAVSDISYVADHDISVLNRTQDDLPGRSSLSSRAPTFANDLDDDDCAPYAALPHAAHVATDDKNILARMANLASAPPVDGGMPFNARDVGSSSAVYPSVPVLDEYEALPSPLQAIDGHDYMASVSSVPVSVSYSSPVSSSPTSPMTLHAVPCYSHDRNSSNHLPLPPPPTKIWLAAPLFYEYPAAFEEDIVGLDPVNGPSAPPFDYHPDLSVPSAPPIMDAAYADISDQSIPCAPPLDLEDETLDEAYATERSPGRDLNEDSHPHSQMPDVSRRSRTIVSTDGALCPPRYLP